MSDLMRAVAEQVISMRPDGTKAEWGEAMRDLADELGDDAAQAWIDDRLVTSLGSYVVNVKRERDQKRANERLVARGVALGTGRPIAPTLSVRTERGTQLMAWTEASPAQFVEAVLREQRVVKGRLDANAVRMALAEAIKDDDELMALPTLADVCTRLGVDPDALGLEALPTEAAS